MTAKEITRSQEWIGTAAEKTTLSTALQNATQVMPPGSRYFSVDDGCWYFLGANGYTFVKELVPAT